MRDTLAIPAELSQLEPVRTWVVDHLIVAGIDEPVLLDVQLAVTEAVANVVRHTFGGSDGNIEVELVLVDGMLRLVITDDGPPWDGTVPSPAEDGAGGYGVPLIEEVMDTVEHQMLEPAGNRLTLEKRVC